MGRAARVAVIAQIVFSLVHVGAAVVVLDTALRHRLTPPATGGVKRPYKRGPGRTTT
ncbi:hypothetical protein [Dactylosporangium sp. NPDC005555]|uniref:hypothetical protein n=1 Tax=Dactylosporangium sp. NPDC005555 TaxID=3154889 RepID=UPI0033AF9581